MPVREVTLYQVYCCVCDVPGPSAENEPCARFEACVRGWDADTSDRCLCPKHKDDGMFGLRESVYVKCCVCDWEGPDSSSKEEAVKKAIALGADVVFRFCQCPRCAENGILPADTPDMRIATVPEPVAIVEGQS